MNTVERSGGLLDCRMPTRPALPTQGRNLYDDYRMPTSLEMIDTVLVEVPNPGYPFGVRGVGEVPIVPAAAVANAIYRATGRRMTDLPMSPGYVLEKMKGSGRWLVARGQ